MKKPYNFYYFNFFRIIINTLLKSNVMTISVMSYENFKNIYIKRNTGRSGSYSSREKSRRDLALKLIPICWIAAYVSSLSTSGMSEIVIGASYSFYDFYCLLNIVVLYLVPVLVTLFFYISFIKLLWQGFWKNESNNESQRSINHYNDILALVLESK